MQASISEDSTAYPVARILIVGNVNIDRVWRLTAPVREGARISYERIEARYGGGGFFTGRTLLSLGHDVRLMTRLGRDDQGRRCLAMLEETGFDTSLVDMSGDVTTPLDILLDPAGERTILFSNAAPRPPVEDIPAGDADLVYLNVRAMHPAASEVLLARHRVVSQFPLQVGERRPAHVLIASRSDVKLEGPARLFAAAMERSAPGLQSLVLTDAGAPVRVVNAAGETLVPVTPCPQGVETTGAGDVFAGGFIDAYVTGQSAVEAARRGNEIAARLLKARAGGTCPLLVPVPS